MSKILVLAGGSVKGAFQAGVMKAMMERGYQPDAVYGVSVGSLNAAYFVNQLGMQALTGGPISFTDASQDLWDFWETRITSPKSLSKPFNIFQLGLTALRKKFKGLVDTQPLRNLLTEVLSIRNLHASPIDLKIGAVNIMDGTIYYVDASEEYLVDRVMDIAVNEILNADIKEVMISNTTIDIQSIRPLQPLTIDIQNFNKMDIRRMLELGYQVGQDSKIN